MVLNAAMNDLVRPAMYDAWHGIVPVSPIDAVAPVRLCSVVGPVCESSDTFAKNRLLPALAPDALRSDSRYRRVWCRHELDLQRTRSGRRGMGGRQTLVGDPRPSTDRGAVGAGAPALMTDPAPPLRRLAARRLQARAAILFEALWPALWPPLAVFGIFLCLAFLICCRCCRRWLQIGLLALGSDRGNWSAGSRHPRHPLAG